MLDAEVCHPRCFLVFLDGRPPGCVLTFQRGRMPSRSGPADRPAFRRGTRRDRALPPIIPHPFTQPGGCQGIIGGSGEWCDGLFCSVFSPFYEVKSKKASGIQVAKVRGSCEDGATSTRVSSVVSPSIGSGRDEDAPVSCAGHVGSQ